MIEKLRLMILSLGLLTFSILNAQNDTIVDSSEKSMITAKSSTLQFDGKYAYRTFEVQANESGNYYFSVWLMGAQTKEGYISYELELNGEKLIEKLSPTKSCWQSIGFKDQIRINAS
ncbi:MAG: hypothetical protein QM751_04430 [Paludibacteraceae bacterium]